MSIQAYMDSHGIAKNVEEVVNAVLKAKAPEPKSFMSEYLRKASPSGIRDVKARLIYDSHGYPALEVDIYTFRGGVKTPFRASVPSHASSFRNPREDHPKILAKEVQDAVRVINDSSKDSAMNALKGMDPEKQEQLDAVLVSETRAALEKRKVSRALAEDAILALSIAGCKAGAAAKGVQVWKHIADIAKNPRPVLPVPVLNMIAGGSRVGNGLPFDHLSILPVGASSFTNALEMGSKIGVTLKALIRTRYGRVKALGEEGFLPPVTRTDEAFQLLVDAIQSAGYSLDEVKIAVDAAASELFFPVDRKYELSFRDSGAAKKNGRQVIDTYQRITEDFSVASFENAFHHDDVANSADLTAEGFCQVVGDEVLLSSPGGLKTAIDGKHCNALLVRVQDLGNVTGAIRAVQTAKEAQWGVVASCEFGNTEDPFIADFAVGVSSGQFKTGAPATCLSDQRLAKYSQLSRIEDGLRMRSDTGAAEYAGVNFRYVPWSL